MTYLGNFGLEFDFFFFFDIWNQCPQLCLIAKFSAERKIVKFETKSALFGYSWAEIWKNFRHIWNQHPQVYLIAKISATTKNP